MSVLSRPQGTPERVWSLVGGLAALGADLPRDDFVALLNPGYVRDGQPTKAATTLANDGLGVAYALGLVDREGDRARLAIEDAPTDLVGFGDRVHDILCAARPDDLNRVILEAYAWLVAESHKRQDVSWVFQVGREEFADMAATGLTGRDDDEDGRLMNTTKVPAWRRWLRFLGLGVPMPDHVAAADFPSPARRIAAELRRAGVAPGTTMPAEDFVRFVAGRCPYLDRGRLFVQACQRIGHSASPRTLSAVLSCGLSDLDTDGTVSLRLSGDAGDGLSLSADPSVRHATFNSVVVLSPEASR